MIFSMSSLSLKEWLLKSSTILRSYSLFNSFFDGIAKVLVY